MQKKENKNSGLPARNFLFFVLEQELLNIITK